MLTYIIFIFNSISGLVNTFSNINFKISLLTPNAINQNVKHLGVETK